MPEDEFDFISNNFEQTCPAAFRRLWKETALSDATLVSEDGKQVESHKVILAASSPFFQDIMKRNQHSHPLIYMRGVKSDDLQPMLTSSAVEKQMFIRKIWTPSCDWSGTSA